jgi:hypothetical protein
MPSRLRNSTSGENAVLSFEVQARMHPTDPKERSQFRVLVHHFLERFFNNDLASSDGEAKAHLIQVACVIGLPGFVMALYLYPAYHLPRGTRPYWSQVGDHYFYVMYSLVAMGIVTIFEWDFFFPDLLDVFVLTSLPVRERRLFLARVAAIFIFIWGFLFDSNFLAPLVLPAATDPPNLARFLIAHLLAVAASGTFAASFFLSLQGLLLVVLGGHLFGRVSLYFQGIAVAALLTLLFLYPVLFGALSHLMRGRNAIVLCLPPFWFLGIYQRLLEGPSVLPIFAKLAQVGCTATLLTIALAGFSYPFVYKRRTRALVEGARARVSRSRIGRPLHLGLHAVLVRSPARRAVWHFISQTLMRVPRYRIYLVMYTGLGIALIVSCVVRIILAPGRIGLALSSDGLRAVIPIVAFWVVSGLRTVFLSPADQRGRWIFRVVDGRPGLEQLTVVKLWVVLWGMLFTLGAAAILRIIAPPALHGWRFTAGQVLVSAGLCLLLTDAFFFNVKTIPFTGARSASTTNLALLLIQRYLFFPPLVLATIGIEPWIEASTGHIAIAASVIVGAHVAMQAINRRTTTRNIALDQLDENEDEFPLRLGLRY